jgi:hypothetical protein
MGTFFFFFFFFIHDVTPVVLYGSKISMRF